MSQIPRRRRAPLAKTRGGLRIFQADGSTRLVPKGFATRAARATIERAYHQAGRQGYD